MDRQMLIAAGSMDQIQKAIDTVANNLSNTNTTGFKQRQAEFSSLLEQNFSNQPDATNSLNRETPLGLRVGTGSKVSSTNMDMSQGSLQQTGRSLDVALTQPDQFFTIQTTDSTGKSETRYTRNGAFYLQPNPSNSTLMNLVTGDGSSVLDPNGKPLQVSSNVSNVTFDSTGTIQATMDNGSKQTLGRLGIVSIARPQLLNSAGDSTYTLPNLTSLKIPVANVVTRVTPQSVKLQSGALEASNVDLTDAMTQLTQLQRAYQFNAKAITISDEMMNLVNTIR